MGVVAHDAAADIVNIHATAAMRQWDKSPLRLPRLGSTLARAGGVEVEPLHAHAVGCLAGFVFDAALRWAHDSLPESWRCLMRSVHESKTIPPPGPDVGASLPHRPPVKPSWRCTGRKHPLVLELPHPPLVGLAPIAPLPGAHTLRSPRSSAGHLRQNEEGVGRRDRALSGCEWWRAL